MDKLFGFVAPVIRATAVPVLNIGGAVLGVVKDGAENIAKFAEQKKKSTAVIGGLLIWLGLDPTMTHRIASVLDVISGWLKAV